MTYVLFQIWSPATKVDYSSKMYQNVTICDFFYKYGLQPQNWTTLAKCVRMLCLYFSYFHLCLSRPIVPVLILLILSCLSQPAHRSCAHTFIFVLAGPSFLCSYFSYFLICLSRPSVPAHTLLILSYLCQPAHGFCAHTSHTFIFVSASPPFLCS